MIDRNCTSTFCCHFQILFQWKIHLFSSISVRSPTMATRMKCLAICSPVRNAQHFPSSLLPLQETT